VKTMLEMAMNREVMVQWLGYMHLSFEVEGMNEAQKLKMVMLQYLKELLLRSQKVFSLFFSNTI